MTLVRVLPHKLDIDKGSNAPDSLDRSLDGASIGMRDESEKVLSAI